MRKNSEMENSPESQPKDTDIIDVRSTLRKRNRRTGVIGVHLLARFNHISYGILRL